MRDNSSSAPNNLFSGALAPDPDLSLAEWSEQNRMLSRKSSSEPGKFRLDRTPYLRGIMDCLDSSSPIQEVAVIKGAQIGGTEVGNCWIGYIIDQCPGQILYILPTTLLARRNARMRIQPLIETTPSLKAKVQDRSVSKARDNMFEKEFPGGSLIISGGNSGSSYRSTPAPYIFLDDLDGFPDEIGEEGDAVSLSRARTRTFPRKKLFFVSTPTEETTSKIDVLYHEGDMRRYFVPCPHCNEYQCLVWSQMVWENKDPETTAYTCISCQKKIHEHTHKTWMLERGEWRATNPETKNKRMATFHLSSLYSPLGWYSWKDAVKEFLEAQKNTTLLKSFVNTVLGEVWKTESNQPDWKRLYDRRESYLINQIPDGVLMLVAGADIQRDRIEVEILGVTENQETYSIDYRVFPGDTTTPAPWEGLDDLLRTQWALKNGINIGIKLLAVDSSFNTQQVYGWCRRYPMNRVIAIKGIDKQSVAVAQPRAVDVTIRGKTLSKGFKIWPIGVSLLKGELYSLLRLEKPVDGEPFPKGYCHFPMYDEEYFKQITAERLVTRSMRGFAKHEWELTRARNEALDCRIYAMACLNALGIPRFNQSHWNKLKEDLRLIDPQNETPRNSNFL